MNKTESVKVTDLQGTVDPSLTSVGLQILKSVMTKRFLCQLCYMSVDSEKICEVLRIRLQDLGCLCPHLLL